MKSTAVLCLLFLNVVCSRRLLDLVHEFYKLENNCSIFDLYTSNYLSYNRWLVWRCDGERLCGGIGDRVRTFAGLLAISMFTKRRLSIVWQKPTNIADIFEANLVDWTVEPPAAAERISLTYFWPVTAPRGLLYQNETVVEIRTNRILFDTVFNGTEIVRVCPNSHASLHLPGGEDYMDLNYCDCGSGCAFWLLFRPSPLLQLRFANKVPSMVKHFNIVIHFRHGGPALGDAVRHDLTKIRCFVKTTEAVHRLYCEDRKDFRCSVLIVSDSLLARHALHRELELVVGPDVLVRSTVDPVHNEHTANITADTAMDIWIDFFSLVTADVVILSRSNFGVFAAAVGFLPPDRVFWPVLDCD